MDVKPIPGLEHEPFAEVWLRAVDEDAWREASAKARDARQVRARGVDDDRDAEVAPWLEAKGYEEVRRYVISELEVANAPDEPPGIPLVTRTPELEPAMYELALQAYPDQPGRSGSRISEYAGWRGWSIDPHPPEACFIALDGERGSSPTASSNEDEDHWTHGFMAVDRAYRGRGLGGRDQARADRLGARERRRPPPHGNRDAAHLDAVAQRSPRLRPAVRGNRAARAGRISLGSKPLLHLAEHPNASEVLAKAQNENFPVALRILPRSASRAARGDLRLRAAGRRHRRRARG